MFAIESEFSQFHLSALDAEMTLCLSLKKQLQPKFSFPQCFHCNKGRHSHAI